MGEHRPCLLETFGSRVSRRHRLRLRHLLPAEGRPPWGAATVSALTITVSRSLAFANGLRPTTAPSMVGFALCSSLDGIRAKPFVTPKPIPASVNGGTVPSQNRLPPTET